MKPAFALLTFLFLFAACGEIPNRDDPSSDHSIFKCAADNCGGGYPLPTATPTVPPTIPAVKDLKFCFPGGSCPIGYEDRGGATYDGAYHNLYQLYQSINVGENYVSEMKEITRWSISTPPAVLLGFNRFSYCEPGSILFHDCVDFYVKYLPYSGSPPATKLVDTYLCIKKDTDGWEAPDCDAPIARPGRTVTKISPDSPNQCIGLDDNGNPHCFNLFIETVP